MIKQKNMLIEIDTDCNLCKWCDDNDGPYCCMLYKLLLEGDGSMGSPERLEECIEEFGE